MAGAPPLRPPWLRALSLLVRLPLALWAELELRGRGVFERLLRPRFGIGGRCRHNGACCHHILMADDPLTTWPLLGALGRFWLCGIYRFRPTANAIELPDGRLARLYTCDNLTAELRTEHNGPRTAIPHHVAKLGAAVHRIDGHDHGVGSHDRVVGDHELRRVLHVDRDTIIGPDADVVVQIPG